MAISFNNALGIHEQALLLRDRRAEVIANNIANADTPGFKARDIDFEGILKRELQSKVKPLDMSTSSALGMTFGSSSIHSLGSPFASQSALAYRNVQQASLDGNTVDEQTENAAFASNALRHQASFQFLNGKFTGMLKAIRGE